ncbi:MAG: hypothetical protein ABH950_06105 [Candidatus Altiarchaeota archaeon]
MMKESLFKPTKLKFLLFIVLFLIFPAPFSYQNFGICRGQRVDSPITCYYENEWSWVALGGVFFIVALFVGGNQVFPLSTDMWEILKILYIIILPYLISCSIFFLRKKKKVSKTTENLEDS